MAIKKIQLYRKNIDNTETLLNPLTKAKYVTMEDGTLIEEALTNKDSSKYTPNIESSKSMFKIGEGDSVDLSSSVVDGAYNSCVLKGRTLVNLHPVKTYRLATHPDDVSCYSNIIVSQNSLSATILAKPSQWVYVDCGIPRLRMLKPNTKYMVIFDAVDNITQVQIMEGTSLGSLTDWAKVENNRAIITTNEFTNAIQTQILYCVVRATQSTYPVNIHVKNARIFEYQTDMENWSIPYFDGMTSVKSPILSNIGKNLFNTSDVFSRHSLVDKLTTYEGSIEYTSKGQYASVTNETLHLEKGKQYTLSAEIKGCRLFFKELINGTYQYYVINKGYTTSYEQGYGSITFTPQTDNCVFEMNTDSTEQKDIGARKIQLEVSLAPTTCEPYKSNISTCETYFDEVSQSDKTIVLRSLPNGICDTLNVETGEYVQRIGERTFNGTESWIMNTEENCQRFTIGSPITDLKSTGDSYVALIVCDKLKSIGWANSWLTVETITVGVGTKNVCIHKPLGTTLDGFKSLLSTTPITIQYELTTPVVRKVDLSGFPYAYKDGHVILSSGSVEPSLTPKVEYSLVANRNGQIEANTKRVLAHQKELDNFEALMLTQMIQSHYEQTLLQFDYGVSTRTLREE